MPGKYKNLNITRIFIAASNVVEDLEALESLKNLPLNEPKEPRRFCVDHPFLFYIIDQLDNLVIAAGKVVDPESPSED